MGIILRTVRFGSEDGSKWVTSVAMIDTGATHCQLTAPAAAELGARLFRRSQVVLADGSIQERDIVYVRVEVDPSLPPVVTIQLVPHPAAGTVPHMEHSFPNHH